MDVLNMLTDIDDRYIIQALSAQNTIRVGKRKSIRRLLIAAVLIILISTAATAVMITQHDFFNQWLLTPRDPTVQEPYLVSNDSNIILDSQSVQIEAVDAIKSGHVIRAGFLVTMKELDSALVSDALPTIKGFTIGDVTDKEHSLTEYGVYYASDGIDVAENQFLYVVTCSITDINQQEIEFVLTDIGYYPKDTGIIVPYKEGTWTWTFSFTTPDQTGATYQINKESITENGETYRVESISISSLGCEVLVRFNDSSSININDINECFTTLSIEFIDGSELRLQASGFSSKEDGVVCTQVIFNSPISTDRIAAIHFMGDRYKL